MAREKLYALKLTKGQLETVQHLLEQAAAGASPDQMKQLEGIDTQIYRLLFPTLTDKGVHPFASIILVIGLSANRMVQPDGNQNDGTSTNFRPRP